MEYVINRLKEASTWAGIAVFFGLFGLDGDVLTRITTGAPTIIAAIASIIAIVAPSVMGKPSDNPVTDHGMTPKP